MGSDKQHEAGASKEIRPGRDRSLLVAVSLMVVLLLASGFVYYATAVFYRNGQMAVLAMGDMQRARQNEVGYRLAMVAHSLGTLLGLGLLAAFYRMSARNAAEGVKHVATCHELAERFRVTLGSVADAVIVTDAAANVTFMNPEAERLTGWATEWRGRPVAEIFRYNPTPPDDPGLHPARRALLEGQIKGFKNHIHLLRKNGDVVSIEEGAAPIHDPGGAVTGAVLVFRDITERRTAERLAISQKEAFEEEAHRKNEFLAVLAHELRNPLAALRNATEVVKLVNNDSPRAEKARTIADRQVRLMARMVDDLVDVARMSTGRMMLRLEPTDVRQIVDAAIETTGPLFEAKSHRLSVSLADEPIFVEGDPVRLAQLLTNLLNNAAKYTERGGKIEVDVSRSGSNAVISVTDNGSGIGTDLLPTVFDQFRQGRRQSKTVSQGGLGIGLTLARRIAQMHGGDIDVASPGKDQGSRFAVTLPLCAAPAPKQVEKVTNAPSRAHRVLVVEDNPDALEALESLLRLSGYPVSSASSGGQALAQAKWFHPTVALVDLGLPGITGHDVARSLRAEPAFAGLHLVAITGWAPEEDKWRSVGAGFTHHLVKPVEPEALFSLLASLPAAAEAASSVH